MTHEAATYGMGPGGGVATVDLPAASTRPLASRGTAREGGGPLAKAVWPWLRGCFAAPAPRFIELLTVAGVAHLCGLLTPLGFQVVFDRVFAQGVEATLLLVVLGLSALALLEGACNGLRARYRTAWAAGVDGRLRPGLVARSVQSADAVGDVTNWLAEAGRLRAAICGPFTEALVDLPLLLLLHAALILVSPTCGLVAVLCAVVIIVVQIASTRGLSRRQRAQPLAQRDATLFAGLAGRNGRHWRMLGAEAGLTQGFASLDAQQVALAGDIELRQTVAREVVQTLLRLQAVLLLGVGAHEVLGGRLGAGGLVACNLLAARLAQPWMRLLAGMEAVATGRHAHERLGVLLAGGVCPLVRRGASGGPRADSRLVLHEVALGGDRALEGESAGAGAQARATLSGTWPAGARLALLAADRATRERALDALMGDRPLQGEAHWQDASGNRLPLAQVLRGVAGGAPLLPATLRENLRLAAPEADDQCLLAALADAGLGDWYARLPEALDTPLSPASGEGQPAFRLRLGLARALVADPPLLACELDPEQMQLAEAIGLWSRLTERRPHTTLLLIGDARCTAPPGFQAWWLTAGGHERREGARS